MDTSAELTRQQFRQLHQQSDILVLPNPWDLGSLQYLEQQGAQAVATTSAGFAWTLAKEDYEITLDESLHHIAELVAATSLPVNADFETGFAVTEAQLRQNIARLEQTGVAAFSIEDRFEDGLYELSEAASRVKAAKQAAIEYGGDDFMLIARCEGLLTGSTGLESTIERLQAYAQSGADVLYAPGLRDLDDIAKVVQAVAPLPLNVLLLQDDLSVEQLASVGVKRVSSGSRLAAAARSAFELAAQALLATGQLPRS
ncbi:isocitrate lyase/phosphoenolpyruvate mutase family protein [Paenalcaligenes niemegkensis]|uniref:isocitrate lyase/PEP mutase family protein n=1 Tax=Paenalcaligenes niemegkensis TaxID=2895469 RepID=UPI001EE95441|nr:isocitrate lyase/phosphoenolpyruvate mutase family protein [Paenalcaligenes niemegkensis]MCQ9618193.1 isocitrate lyase/phosphoenolpyruvate mutase family protein [Paenalcaligenes niemegkensis]